MTRASTLPDGIEHQFINAPFPPDKGDIALFLVNGDCDLVEVSSDVFLEGGLAFVLCSYNGKALGYPVPIDRLIQIPEA